jgi:hyperosmotically inducible protein
MRLSMIGMVLGVCGLLAGAGCADMKKAESSVEAEAKNVNTSNLKGDLEAIKKGDVKAVGDDALTTHVKTQLAADPTTKPANFTVAVKGGVVTLTGTGSAAAKTQAEKVAKGVTGVSSVTNQITVK